MSQIYRTVVLVWITLSVASVILATANWVQLSRKLTASARAVDIQDAAYAVLKSLLDAESAQRGFTISGSEEFLEPYNAAEARLPFEFNRLADLVSLDPGLLRQVLDLRAQAELALSHHRKVVAIRRERGLEAAAAIVSAGEGKRAMDVIRRQVEAITAARSSLASGLGRASGNQLLRASLTSLVAGALGIGAGLFALYLARVSWRHQQSEHQMLEAKLQAERESQEKSTFLANMSHEIRTPMNAILGFSELLASELRDPKHQEYLQSIRSSSASLLQLINDVLDMSKGEAGVLEMRPEPTDPREICDFIMTVFRELAAKKGVKVECKVAEDLPRALLLDRVRLRQILVNLVGNGIKFTDQGQIHTAVTWERLEDSSHINLIIEVRDTGVGIPQDKLDAIFKPFVQAGTHRDKEKLGSGLGLAIVKRLTQAMGGTVTVQSSIGKGSTFQLRIPKVAISARIPLSEQADARGTANLNDLAPANILVVDDNETNCKLVAGMFEGTHHRIEFGSNGAEAVAKARSLRPDLILMDVRMPQVDGREALGQIREIPGLELLPVIALTASTLLDEDGTRQKFNGYLRKPFTRRELFDELSQFLVPAQKDGLPERALPDWPAPAAGQDHPWRGLALQLRRLQEQEWPGLRDAMAVNECKAFAHKLDQWARETNCPTLLIYADALAHYAETYAVDALEKHLREFPELVNRVDQHRV